MIKLPSSLITEETMPPWTTGGRISSPATTTVYSSETYVVVLALEPVPVLQETLIVNLYSPAAVGVPEIVPSSAIDKPVGNAPLLTAYFALFGTPAIPQTIEASQTNFWCAFS